MQRHVTADAIRASAMRKTRDKAKSKPKVSKSKVSKPKTSHTKPRAGKLQAGKKAAIASATRTLELEIAGLASLAQQLTQTMADPFFAAVSALKSARGRVIVTGIGKSGHIGQKVAATFASTGTPAFFVHPSEASHGDLGMITPDDVILAMSWSGETVELFNIITYSRRFKVPLIAITSRHESALATSADVALILPKATEACPHGLAPTTSTTLQLALGDALAVALLESKGFTAHDFKVFHPGGSLGARLKFVADIMHQVDRLPLAPATARMSDALVTMTQKSFGCLGIVDRKGRLIGIVTDGDLRRHMGKDLLTATTADIMTRNPKTVEPSMLASAALELINASRITSLFVVEKSRPVGIIHIHDLLRQGIA